MISLLHLNKFTKFIIFFIFLISSASFAADPVDIWKSKENKSGQNDQLGNNSETEIESPILAEDPNKILTKIDQQELKKFDPTLVGIFDPEENGFTLNMWSQSNGEDIKKILKRINKLKLSKISEDLLFQVLFTNAHPPKDNLTSEEFLEMKIDWLIKNNRYKDLESLLKTNSAVGKNTKAVKFLINEYLSSADVKSACEKTNFISKDTDNVYLDKFTIYCLINNDRKNEAQLFLDLIKERGLNDNFFETKINFLLGITKTAGSKKILDDNLLNFYLSHITSDDFEYVPDEKTNKYIWRYLSSANLIQVKDFENEDVIATYEQAAKDNSFEKEEIFKIYLRMYFNFNQLINANEIYKTMPNYKARALIYQSILLSDNVEKKLNLAFLLKDLFMKDKMFDIYSDELTAILKSIKTNEIPENYADVIAKHMEQKYESDKEIKFDNDVLHRSKVLKHFFDNEVKIRKTEKDFKSVYKKIKKNKKYFISINDIIVLESLAADGILLPKELDYSNLASQLTVPQSLQDLVKQKQTGLVMLKLVEIIGEDDVRDLDPETIYFLSRILNELNLKEIRNNILSKALPVRV